MIDFWGSLASVFARRILLSQHPARVNSRPRLRKLEDRLNPSTALLPDLHVLQSYLPSNPTALQYNNLGNGRREIRFATGMANGGQGPFELQGTSTIITNPDGSQSQLVNQRIYYSNGTHVDVPAGYFTYHPGHGHTHFDDFARAYIRVRPADQSIGPVVAESEKTSFCLMDMNRYNPGLPGSPATAQYSCTSVRQGISVGWNDVYGAGLDGQSIEITGLPNGDYWLEVVADPMNSIQETNETNNTTRVPITITGQPSSSFRVLSMTPTGAQNNPVAQAELVFSMAVDAATFTPADVTFSGPNGPIGVTGVTALSTHQFRIEFPLQADVGTYNLSVGPNISSTTGLLMDQNGNGIGGQVGDEFQTTFVIVSPRVAGYVPTGVASPPVSQVTVTYNKPMNSATFTLADVFSFTGPNGDLLPAITSVTPVSGGGTSSNFVIAFPGQSTPGLYTMVLGADVQDPHGNYVDQNQDGLTQTVDDRYTLTFVIPVPGTHGPDTFGYDSVAGTYTSNSIVGTPGVFTIVTSGDDVANPVNLGANSFSFYGQSYTGNNQLYVSTNGLITFGSANTAYSNEHLGATGVSQPAIAPLWDDWKTGSGSPAVVGKFIDDNGDGATDGLVVEWNQVFHYSTSSNGVTFQAILQLNTGATAGDIRFNYIDLISGSTGTSNGGSATVGIKSGAVQGSFVQVSMNSNSNSLIGNGKAIMTRVPRVMSITRMGGATIEQGDAEWRVEFSHPVTGVDHMDFLVVGGGNVTGAYVDHIHTTANPRVFEVHAYTGVGAGTLRLDLIDNDSIRSTLGARLGGLGTLNGNFVGQTYTVTQPAPTVELMLVNGGASPQRSRVSAVAVLFSRQVAFAGGNVNAAFTLTGPGGAAVPFQATVAPGSPLFTLVNFSFPNLVHGSLPDGVYTLTALSSAISTGGVPMAADAVMTFHRLFGDVNGDGTVNFTDFLAFRTAFGGSGPGVAPFDANGDGVVDFNDYLEFRARFGVSLTP